MYCIICTWMIFLNAECDDNHLRRVFVIMRSRSRCIFPTGFGFDLMLNPLFV